jgi:hypothetical protein
VHHRAERTKNRVTRSTFLGSAFELPEEAAMSWLRNCAPEKVAELLAGKVYEDGIPEARSMHPRSIGEYLNR